MRMYSCYGICYVCALIASVIVYHVFSTIRGASHIVHGPLSTDENIVSIQHRFSRSRQLNEMFQWNNTQQHSHRTQSESNQTN